MATRYSETFLIEVKEWLELALKENNIITTEDSIKIDYQEKYVRYAVNGKCLFSVDFKEKKELINLAIGYIQGLRRHNILF